MQTGTTLPTYAEYAPTALDCKGAFLPDRQDWYVLPLMLTRDTCDPLAISNWEVAKGILDDASAEYEIHRFGHWGPGWFEIILVHPDSVHVAQDIADRLEDYPVLDETDYSAQECETQQEDWENYGRSDFMRECQRLVESWDNDNGDDAPYWQSQDYCQHTGMPVMVCPCGDCITTNRQAAERALDWLDSATTEEIDEFARSVERYCEHSGEGTSWTHDITAERIFEAAGL